MLLLQIFLYSPHRLVPLIVVLCDMALSYHRYMYKQYSLHPATIPIHQCQREIKKADVSN